MPAAFSRGFLFILLFAWLPGLAMHDKGGSIVYTWGGSSNGQTTYYITIKHYLDCKQDRLRQNEESAGAQVGVFDAKTGSRVTSSLCSWIGSEQLQKTTFSPCINPHPTICYYVVSFSGTITVPDNPNGYVLAEQECCRIAGIINVPGSNGFGITITTTIPGTINGVNYSRNSNPVFAQRDSAVVCHNSPFTIDFSASDLDGDSLAYAFTAGLTSGPGVRGSGSAPTAPPYSELPYEPGFSAQQPLGTRVTLDPHTGIISGIAPAATGTYVVAVNVYEYRNGVLLGASKKEVHIDVADCSLSAAELKPEYVNCNDFHFRFENESAGANIDHYLWSTGIPGRANDTTPVVDVNYPDTGVYVLKLKVSTTQGCLDSAQALVRVFPGFRPGFTTTGSCYQVPFQFQDTTYARYGFIDSLAWDFGDLTTVKDTSSLRNPTWQYADTGTKSVVMFVHTSKGCSASVTNPLRVTDRPPLALKFRDTLICSIDTLQLFASGVGTIRWLPSPYLSDTTAQNPLVFPRDTAIFRVRITDRGCVGLDSVKVNVLPFVTVRINTDTVICRGDSITLRPVSYALQYSWTPATGLSDPSVKYPMAAPADTITYKVTANLGKCQDQASVRVMPVAYPGVNAGNDTLICYSQTAQLHATIKGSSFTWSPTASLLNSNTLNPIAGPTSTTLYTLTVYDNKGCPKPSADSILVTVAPRVLASAGRDTSVVVGQPLQLNATGGAVYAWSPSLGLNNASIPNPIGKYGTNVDSVKYTVTVTSENGCSSSANVRVVVYKTDPDLMVPSAFTPNGDGRNDIIRPILYGMRGLVYFSIYSRWGELLYTTNVQGSGWDGRFNGVPQPAGTYVYTIRGIDYKGNQVDRKGAIVLIR